jgi:hypothetical protein
MIRAMFWTFFILITLPLYANESCNGHASLCSRPYNEVTYPTTHNSTSTEFGKTRVRHFTNQDHGIKKQLQDGIRAFMIDLYQYKDTIYTCHKLCLIGGAPFAHSLQTIKKFLEENPQEVVTLLLESHVDGDKVETAFREIGLLHFVYTYQNSWPTLLEMIQKNRRLVVLTEKKVGGPKWYQPMWELASDTSFKVSNSGSFDCDLNRGKKENSLFIMNHFVTKFWNRKANNLKANEYDFIISRAQKCHKARGKRPNFIAVDFYESGDLIKAVKTLNQLP